MKFFRYVAALALLALAACHPGPVITTDPKQPVGGTIAGIVSSSAKAAVVGRKVTAINTLTGTQFDATTGANGGYTIKVPEGTYKIEVELNPGETLAKQPGETKINKSDLDARRDFVIAGVKSDPLI
jgi:Carboxypeptidase regulatory-like domain